MRAFYRGGGEPLEAIRAADPPLDPWDRILTGESDGLPAPGRAEPRRLHAAPHRGVRAQRRRCAGTAPGGRGPERARNGLVRAGDPARHGCSLRSERDRRAPARPRRGHGADIRPRQHAVARGGRERQPGARGAAARSRRRRRARRRWKGRSPRTSPRATRSASCLRLPSPRSSPRPRAPARRASCARSRASRMPRARRLPSRRCSSRAGCRTRIPLRPRGRRP